MAQPCAPSSRSRSAMVSRLLPGEACTVSAFKSISSVLPGRKATGVVDSFSLPTRSVRQQVKSAKQSPSTPPTHTGVAAGFSYSNTFTNKGLCKRLRCALGHCLCSAGQPLRRAWLRPGLAGSQKLVPRQKVHSAAER